MGELEGDPVASTVTVAVDDNVAVRVNIMEKEEFVLEVTEPLEDREKEETPDVVRVTRTDGDMLDEAEADGDGVAVLLDDELRVGKTEHELDAELDVDRDDVFVEMGDRDDDGECEETAESVCVCVTDRVLPGEREELDDPVEVAHSVEPLLKDALGVSEAAGDADDEAKGVSLVFSSTDVEAVLVGVDVALEDSEGAMVVVIRAVRVAVDVNVVARDFTGLTVPDIVLDTEDVALAVSSDVLVADGDAEFNSVGTALTVVDNEGDALIEDAREVVADCEDDAEDRAVEVEHGVAATREREDTKETEGDVVVVFVAKEDLELRGDIVTLENAEMLGDSLPDCDTVKTNDAVAPSDIESITDDVAVIEGRAEFDAEGDPVCDRVPVFVTICVTDTDTDPVGVLLRGAVTVVDGETVRVGEAEAETETRELRDEERDARVDIVAEPSAELVNEERGLNDILGEPLEQADLPAVSECTIERLVNGD